MKRVNHIIFSILLAAFLCYGVDANDAIFKLETDRGQGTGFLVTDDGWGITNEHVIRGVKTARASFEDGFEAEVELWAAWPRHDLALLMIELESPRSALSVASDVPQPGSEVRAWGYPAHGYTVTRGIINGVRRAGDLSESQHIWRKFHPDSTWLEMDAPINPGNSGGPLLNTANEVVGVNTFVLLAGSDYFNNLYFAVSAAHVKEILAERSNDPLTFARSQDAQPEDQHIGDLPSIDIEPSQWPAQLVSRARAFFSDARCRPCRATGTVTTRVQVGWEQVTANTRRPIMRNVQRSCSTCNGAGLNVSRMNDHMERIAETVVYHDQSAPRTDAAYERFLESLRNTINLNRENFFRIVRATLTDDSEVGDIVVLHGAAVVDIHDYFGHTAHLAGTPELMVIAWNMNIIDFEENSPRFLIAGILAGYLKVTDEDRIPVIQHGMIVGY